MYLEKIISHSIITGKIVFSTFLGVHANLISPPLALPPSFFKYYLCSWFGGELKVALFSFSPAIRIVCFHKNKSIGTYTIFAALDKNTKLPGTKSFWIWRKTKKNLMITQNVSGISFSNQNLYMYITTYIEQYIAQL